MIDDFIAQKIKDTSRIVDVIGGFYPLRKSGVEYECLCPFHADRHMGSFKISRKKNYAKCFSCGWQGGPVDFIMKHEGLSYYEALVWLAEKYGIDVGDKKSIRATATVKRMMPAPLETLTLPMAMVKAREGQDCLKHDSLVRWIRNGINWDAAQRHRIESVISDYHIGHSRYGHTIFWQIDEQQQVRTGKMMKYKPDGHRDKSAKWNFDWIHSTLLRHRDSATGKITTEPPYPYPHIYNPEKQDVQLTMFGMHLLDAYRRKDVEQTVCIVESEKTAILMAIAYGNNTKEVWMACGGLELLSRERLLPLIEQGRRIILYPDRDAIQRWEDKAASIGYERMTVDSTPVRQWWKPEFGAKADIADVVVGHLNVTKPRTASITELIQDHPELKPIVNKFKLTEK